MDNELLIALCVFWLSSTTSIIVFFIMWWFNDGEAFHPHSIDIDHRHKHFVVVGSTTECKFDCAVQSISAFVAPRGSSSSKQFTVLCIMIAVSGFMGTSRWYAVGDATFLEAVFAFIGFAALLPVACFELDVAPERFLNDKLLVTGWLLEKLVRHRSVKTLPFKLHPSDKHFRAFVLQSRHIAHLYDEEIYITKSNRQQRLRKWNYDLIWSSMHMLGALAFMSLVPAAILLNDMAEEKVAWITGFHFLFFGWIGYLTGSYLPVIGPLRCWILVWNPFLREPLFMAKLKLSAQEYNDTPARKIDDSMTKTSKEVSSVTLKNRRKRIGDASTKHPHEAASYPAIISEQFILDADLVLDNFSLRFARRHPKAYLQVVGHLLVTSELIALLTPVVAMGIQWVTALCDGPPVLALLDLLWLGAKCVIYRECATSDVVMSHCILK